MCLYFLAMWIPEVDPTLSLSPLTPPPSLPLLFSWKEEGRPEFLGAERRPAVLRFRLEANVGAEVSEGGRGRHPSRKD